MILAECQWPVYSVQCGPDKDLLIRSVMAGPRDPSPFCRQKPVSPPLCERLLHLDREGSNTGTVVSVALETQSQF